MSTPGAPRPIGPIGARAEPISEIAFAGDVLAVTSATGTVTIWDARRGRSLSMTTYAKSLPPQAVLSSDGRRVAFIDQTSARTVVWDVGAPREQILAANASVPLAFGEDGTKLLTLDRTESGDRLRFWDVVSRRAVQLPGDISAGAKVAVSRNGRLAAAAVGSITLWEDGKQLARTSAPEFVTALAVSADGRHVAWGGPDGTLAVWDPRDDQPRTLRSAHQQPIEDIALTRPAACWQWGRTIRRSLSGRSTAARPSDGSSATPTS